MCAVIVVVLGVRPHAAQMRGVENYHVVEAFAPEGTDQPLDMGRSPKANAVWLDALGLPSHVIAPGKPFHIPIPCNMMGNVL